MNVRHPMVVLHLFSIKNIFYEKIDLSLVFFMWRYVFIRICGLIFLYDNFAKQRQFIRQFRKTTTIYTTISQKNDNLYDNFAKQRQVLTLIDESLVVGLSPFNLTANVSDDMNITVNWKQPVTAIDVNDTYYQLTRQCQPYELHKSTYIDNITFAGKPVVTSCPYCKSFTCKIELCLMQKHTPGKKYCAHIFKKMKSATEPPSMPPTIEKVIGGRESVWDLILTIVIIFEGGVGSKLSVPHFPIFGISASTFLSELKQID